MGRRPKEFYDVVVIGGGAAGLAGAVALARSLRRVLVIDAGEPRNAPAHAVHNLLGREGTTPLALLEAGRAEAAAVGAQIRTDRVVALGGEAEDFWVSTAAGEPVRARRLLVTTGLRDELPDVPGLAQRWGREVLHCPYCHGYEVRGRAIGVLATGPAVAHQAPLFAQLSDRVTVFTHAHQPDPAALERLAAAGVAVVSGRVAGMEGEPLAGLRLADGALHPVDALVVAPRMVADSPLLDSLGLVAREHPSGMGEHYPSEATGATSVPGLWIAGNVADITAQVGGAAAAGTLAGAAINADLIEADLLARTGALA